MKHARLVPIVEDTLLTPREIEAKLSAAFPEAHFDWEKANAKLELELRQLLAMGVGEPIIRGHRNLFGNVVWVRVPILDREPITFYAYPDSYLRIEVPANASPDFHNALKAIANAMDYCVEYEVDS